MFFSSIRIPHHQHERQQDIGISPTTMHHHFVEVLALSTMAKVEKPWTGLEDKSIESANQYYTNIRKVSLPVGILEPLVDLYSHASHHTL
jgi:hypothetical protein